MNKDNNFNFVATGIGSVPWTDISETCNNILSLLPDMPFWPQFVKRSLFEDMSIQFSEGLPLISVDEEKKSLNYRIDNMENELVAFYDPFMASDYDSFSISEEYAPGLYSLIERVSSDPKNFGPFIKGHTVGPVTFAASLTDKDGNASIFNPDLLDAFVKGLAIKALWQSRLLEKTGKQVILFLDEPYLSGFGSAFTSIQRHEVISILKEVIDYIKDNTGTLVGIHCCGNTDWPMIMETGADIINFDAFEFMEHFLLYPKELKHFIEKGGIIAWGIVPTSGFTGDETIDILKSKLMNGLEQIEKWGINYDRISRQSILTPACGMGTMEPHLSQKVIELLSGLSKTMGKI